MDELWDKAWRWFVEHRTEDGLVADRSKNRADGLSPYFSIAAIGYYLSLLPEAVQRGLITEKEAQRSAKKTVQTVLDLEHHEGLLYHFLDASGRRWGQTEFSILDTSILANGCMVAAGRFKGLTRLVNSFLNRIDWPKLLLPEGLLSLGWSPEEGLLGPADRRSSEFAMCYVLAAGSQKHPIPADLWLNTKVLEGMVCGYRILNPDLPLFTSYFGQEWMNLWGRWDKQGISLHKNARRTLLANRSACFLSGFRSYSMQYGGWWGVSAGDCIDGYLGVSLRRMDGTVHPMAALGGYRLAEDILLTDLMRWRCSPVWDAVSGDYGLAPFNIDKGWFGTDVIGIDLGSFAACVSRLVQPYWKMHPVAQRGVNLLFP